MKNLPQKIGIGLLLLAGILGWMGEFGFGWIAYGVVGLITAGCAIHNEVVKPTRTVSQYIQDLTFDKPIDYTAGLVIIAFCAWRHFSLFNEIDLNAYTPFELGMIAAYWSLPIGLAIHFFANKD